MKRLAGQFGLRPSQLRYDFLSLAATLSFMREHDKKYRQKDVTRVVAMGLEYYDILVRDFDNKLFCGLGFPQPIMVAQAIRESKFNYSGPMFLVSRAAQNLGEISAADGVKVYRSVDLDVQFAVAGADTYYSPSMKQFLDAAKDFESGAISEMPELEPLDYSMYSRDTRLPTLTIKRPNTSATDEWVYHTRCIYLHARRIANACKRRPDNSQLQMLRQIMEALELLSSGIVLAPKLFWHYSETLIVHGATYLAALEMAGLYEAAGLLEEGLDDMGSTETWSDEMADMAMVASQAVEDMIEDIAREDAYIRSEREASAKTLFWDGFDLVPVPHKRMVIPEEQQVFKMQGALVRQGDIPSPDPGGVGAARAISELMSIGLQVEITK